MTSSSSLGIPTAIISGAFIVEFSKLISKFAYCLTFLLVDHQEPKIESSEDILESLAIIEARELCFSVA